MASLFQNPTAPVPVAAPAGGTPTAAEEEEARKLREQQFRDARERSLRAQGVQGVPINVDPAAIMARERMNHLVQTGQVPISRPADNTLLGDLVRFGNAGVQLALDPVGQIIGKDNLLSKLNPGRYVGGLLDEGVDALLPGGSGIQGGNILPGTTWGQDMQGKPSSTVVPAIKKAVSDAANWVGDTASGAWNGVKDAGGGVRDWLNGPAFGRELPQLPASGPTSGTSDGGVLSPDAAGALDRAKRAGEALNMGSAPQVPIPASSPDPGQQDVLNRILAFLDAPQGPSVAEEAIKRTQAENSANLLGLARSAGTAGDRAATIGNALFGGAGQAQVASGQAAELKAKEAATRRAQLLEGLGLASGAADAARSGDILLRGQNLDVASQNANRTLEQGRLALDTEKLGQDFALGLAGQEDQARRTDLLREAENRMRVQGQPSMFSQIFQPTLESLASILALYAKS